MKSAHTTNILPTTFYNNQLNIIPIQYCTKPPFLSTKQKVIERHDKQNSN